MILFTYEKTKRNEVKYQIGSEIVEIKIPALTLYLFLFVLGIITATFAF